MKMALTPSMLALVLGVLQRDIWQWIDSGELEHAMINDKTPIMSAAQVGRYLYNHPENVGRVYCDDLASQFINDARREIVEQIEVLHDVQPAAFNPASR